MNGTQLLLVHTTIQNNFKHVFRFKYFMNLKNCVFLTVKNNVVFGIQQNGIHMDLKHDVVFNS